MKKLVLLIGLFISTPLFAVQYEIIDLRTIGGSSNYVRAINDNGWMVGKTYPSSTGVETAVLWKDGQMIELGGDNGSYAADINNSDQIIVNNHNDSCFIWDNSIITPLNGLDHGSAINSSGHVAGYYEYDSGLLAPAIWHDGTTDSRGPLFHLDSGYPLGINDTGWMAGRSKIRYGDTVISQPCYWVSGGPIGIDAGGNATDINNSNQIVGSNMSGFDMQAFLWENGTVTNLGNFGGDSYAYAINENSQIVGHSFTSGGAELAYIWEDGVMTSLKSLIPTDSGWTPRYAFDINNNGWIIGEGYYNGEYHSFLMTPIPEPATLSLLALGAMLMGRRRK